MKNFFLTFGIISSLILTTSCSSDEGFETLENTEIQTNKLLQKGDVNGSVTTVWSIGRKSKNCFKIGICKIKKVVIEIESIEATVYDNRMFAADVRAIDSNNLILQVDGENIKDIIKEFGGEYLILDEDYVIDDKECGNLNLSNGFTIKAGKHTLIKNKLTSLFEVEISN